MTGAKHNMLEQAARSHNLANVSTVGFKADLANAIAQPVYGGDGFQSRTYAIAQTPSTNLSNGTMLQTGRELDIALDGEGWIAVQNLDGEEGYTRDGNLLIDTVGILRNARGQAIMGNAGPIAIPEAEKVEIGSDGTISVRALGQGPETLVIVDRIKLVNPEQADLAKREDGIIYSANGIEPVDPDVRLRTGFLENSNVNAVEELTQIVSLARQFEMQIKMMQTVSDNAQSSARILQVQV